MADLGKLWFSLGLKDVTDEDYEKIRKELGVKLKNPIKIPVGIEDQIGGGRGKAEKLLSNLTRIHGALDRINTLENRIRMNSRFTGGGKGYDEAIRKLDQLKSALNSLDSKDTNSVRSSVGSGFTRELNAIRLLVQEQDKLNNIQRRSEAVRLARETGQAADQQSRLARYTGETNTRLLRQSRIAGELRNQIAGYLSIYTAERFLGSVIQIGGEFEKQKIALKSILGDASKAESIFSQIKTLAVESPFQFKDLASYTKQLTAFSIPYEELYDTTKRLADISAGLGVDMGRIILAYGQVRSAAFLRGQEVRQFTEAGIPLIDELAKKFEQLEGHVVSSGEVFERISKRMVSFEMVKDVLWDLTNEGGKFYNMQEELAKSLAGKWSNLRDSYDIMLSEIADGNNGVLKGSIDLLTILMNNWEKAASILGAVVAIYVSYKAAIVAANTWTGIQTIATRGYAGALDLANKRMQLNVAAMKTMNLATATAITRVERLRQALSMIGKAGWVGIVLGAIASVSYAIYNVYKEANKLNNELEDIANKSKSSSDLAVSGYKNLVDSLKNAGEGTKKRLDLINQINTRYGEYLPNLFKETDANEKIAASIDSVTEAIKRRMQAQSYEEGLQKINEHYTERFKEVEEGIEKRVRRVYGFKSGEEKSFVRSLLDRIKKEGDIQDLEQIVREVAAIFGKGSSNYNMAAGITAIGSNVYNGKSVKDYIELLKEQKKAEDDLSNSLNKRYEGLGLYGDKLREIEDEYSKTMPSDPDKAREHEIEMLKKQLDVLSSVNDAYTERIKEGFRARIKELSKERMEWSKYANTLSKQSKTFGDVTASLSFISPRKEEEFDFVTYVGRLRTEYKSLKEELDKFKGLPLENIDQNKRKSIEYQLSTLDNLAKKWNITLKEDKKEKDPVAEEWKKRVDLMDKAISMYNKWKEIIGEDKAKNRVQGDKTFSEIFSDKNLKSILDDSDKVWRYVLGQLGNTEKQKDLKIKVGIKIDENAFEREKEVKQLLDKYQKDIDRINQKYNEDISKLEKGRTSENSAQVDLAIAEANTRRAKELMIAQLDLLKKNPDYIRAFEDLQGVSSETLRYLIEEFNKYMQVASSTLDPSEMREYVSTVKQMNDELFSRQDVFERLLERQKELTEAQIDLDIARELGSDSEIREATDNASKALNKYLKAVKEAINKTDELGKSMSSIGDTIGGTGGRILSLAGDITSFVSSSIESITLLSIKGEMAIKGIERANVILSIASAALQVLQKIGSFFNNDKAYEQYEKYAEKIREINQLAHAVNNYKIAVAEARAEEENWFGGNNLKELRDFKKIQEEVARAYYDKAYESQAIYQNKKGGKSIFGKIAGVLGGGLVWDSILGTNMTGFFGKDYEKGTTAAINNLRIETRSRKKGGLFRRGRDQKTEDLVTWARSQGLGELFDKDNMINKELAQTLIDEYGNKLVGQTKETLESLIELREKYDEYIEQLHDYVNNLYQPVVDDFMNSLWDWYDEGKDVMDSFKEYASDTFRDIASDVMRTLLLNNVFDNFKDNISKLYEEYSKGSITEAQLMEKVAAETGNVMDRAEDNLPVLENIMNSIGDSLRKAGIEIKQTEELSSSMIKSTSGITEEAGNLIVSYVNAIRADGSVRRSLLEKLVNDMYPQTNMIAQAQLTELKQIQINTANNVQVLTEFRDLFKRVITPGSGYRMNI